MKLVRNKSISKERFNEKPAAHGFMPFLQNIAILITAKSSHLRGLALKKFEQWFAPSDDGLLVIFSFDISEIDENRVDCVKIKTIATPNTLQAAQERWRSTKHTLKFSCQILCPQGD